MLNRLEYLGLYIYDDIHFFWLRVIVSFLGKLFFLFVCSV